MLTLPKIGLDKNLSFKISLALSKKAYPIWEERYPADNRVLNTIEKLEKFKESGHDGYLFGSSNTYYAYLSAIDEARNSNPTAPDLRAAYAAHTAYSCLSTIGLSIGVYSVAACCNAAFDIFFDNPDSIIVESVLQEMLPVILRYKIESQKSFGSPEEIFEYLDDSDKELFMYNLNVLTGE